LAKEDPFQLQKIYKMNIIEFFDFIILISIEEQYKKSLEGGK